MKKNVVANQVRTLLNGILITEGRKYESMVSQIRYAEKACNYKLYNIYKCCSFEKYHAYNQACECVNKRFTYELGYQVLHTLVWGNIRTFTITFVIHDVMNGCYIYLIWTKENNYYIISDKKI